MSISANRSSIARMVLFLTLFLLGFSHPGDKARQVSTAAASIGNYDVPLFLVYRRQSDLPSRLLGRVTLHITRAGDTFWSIARFYGRDIYELLDANPQYDPRQLPVGVSLNLPLNSTPKSSRPLLRMPLMGRITSPFGMRHGQMHTGIDIAAPMGAPVRAAAAGHVVFAGSRQGYGLMVVLEHENGWETVYAHNSRLLVKAGQWVTGGEKIAEAGATGNATGTHLHFEMLTDGNYVDPLTVLLR